MNTVFSFVAIGVTFAIGVLGTLFDYVQRDDEGNRKESKLGIPVPTTAGRVCLLLLVLSFGCSCYLTYRSSEDSRNTRQQLTDMQTANEIAERKIRGSAVKITSFWLQMFFLGNPQRQVDESVEAASHNRFPSSANLTLMEKLACDAPSNVTISLLVPVTDSPLFDEEITASRNDNRCSASGSIGTAGSNRTVVSPVEWTQIYLKDKDKIMLYTGRFTSDLLITLPGYQQLTAASFYTVRRAVLSISYDTTSDAQKLEAYFTSSLPKVVGFSTIPNDDPRSDLGASKAFFLDRLLPQTPATPLNHLYYTYEPGAIGKNWPYFARKDTAPSSTGRLPNPYRVTSTPVH